MLLRDLGFANGIKLSDDESFLVVAESLTHRVLKYYLKGPKAGQHEIFIEGLPGLPDNIHSDGHGGFIVTTVIGASTEHPILMTSLMPHPYIRKMLLRLMFLVDMPLEMIQHYYPNTCVEKFRYWFGSFSMSQSTDSMKRSIVFRVDASGNILDILSSDDTDIVNHISSGYIHNGYLWLGSPWNSYVLRVPLKHAFPDLAVDGGKTSSHAKSEKQLPKATASDAKAERVKRDMGSATAEKTVESKPKKTATPKASTAAPKPTAAPTTTTKPTAAPKAAPKKVEKPATTDRKVKSSETKPASKSTNADVKNDVKTGTKSNAKPETNDKTRENTAKTSTKSDKKMKVEQDASAKAQKVNSRK